MRYLSIALFSVGLILGCTSGFRDQDGGGGSSAVDEVQRGASVAVSAADYDRLWAVALEVIQPFGATVQEKDEGRIESRDFYHVVNGIPIYRYVEILLQRDALGPQSCRVVVSVYRFERRYEDGSPIGEGKFDYVPVGLDDEFQEQMAQTIYRQYLAAAGSP